MTDKENCIRRVTASFSDPHIGKLPGVCANSICSGLCASDMNSGDRNACRTCIYGVDPKSHQIIEDEKVDKIVSSWWSNQDPSLFQCTKFVGNHRILASIRNACSNSKCTQTLTNLCDNERKESPTKCGACVGQNAQAAQNAGCNQQDITSWCSDQSSIYACNSTDYCSADPQGRYPDMNTCTQACKWGGYKFSCPPGGGGGCIVDPNGKYSDLGVCQKACKHSDTQVRIDMK
jgi:hypothetical protein